MVFPIRLNLLPEGNLIIAIALSPTLSHAFYANGIFRSFHIHKPKSSHTSAQSDTPIGTSN